MVAMDPWRVGRPGRAGPPGRALRRAARLGAARGAGHALRALPVDRLRRAAPAHGLGPRRRPAHRPRPAPSGSRSPAAAPSPTAACSACSWPAPSGPPGSASSTRRWSTSRASATCSCSAPPPGGSRTSRPTGCWSPPRPGAAARMPFWKGDQPGRPVELGRAIGARLRELVRHGRRDARPRRCADGGLDEWAAGNLLAYLRRAARGDPARCPTTARCVVERFRDELGDWRLAVHCVLGAQVNGAVGAGDRPPAHRAVRRGRPGHAQRRRHRGAAARRRADAAARRRPGRLRPGRDRADGRGVGRHARRMFAARFRECAARSLLLPRRDPRRRQPLWQQRQRAAQLLDVAREYADFPVTLEAARECLQDVLRRARPGRADARRGRPQGAAGRGGDAAAVAVRPVAALRLRRRVPVRGRRAAGRAPGRRAGARLHPARRAARPGRAARAARPGGGRRDRAAAAVARPTQRRPRDAEDVAELLRLLGDLSDAELAERGAPTRAWLAELGAARRAIRVRIAGEERWIARRGRRPAPRRARAWRCRSGVAAGVPGAGRRPARRPGRPLRPHPRPVHRGRLRRPLRARRVRGRAGAAAGSPPPGGWSPASSRPSRRAAPSGATPRCCACCAAARWPRCAARSSRCRRAALAAFLPRWQHVGVVRARRRGGGRRGRAAAGRRRCRPRRWSGWCCPARVADYSPAYLDELCASGEVVWAGAGAIPGGDGWVTLAYADTGAAAAPAARPRRSPSPRCTRRCSTRSPTGRRCSSAQLADRVGGAADDADVLAAACGTWSGPGWLTNDTLAPLRALLGGGGGAHRAKPAAPRTRYRRARPGRARPPAPARPPWPAAGPGCPSATPTRPAAPPRWPTRCWSGTAWSPAAR